MTSTGGGPVSPPSEFDLVLPELAGARLGGVDGRTLLLGCVALCLGGLAFGVSSYLRLRRLPVHPAMRAVSELIYATCKTYLVTQVRFIALLYAFIAAVLVAYFGFTRPVGALELGLVLGFGLLGIAGSVGVAAFGIRVNTFANSRTAYAALAGRPLPVHDIPLRAGMSVGMVLISVELLLMVLVLLLVPRELAYKCFLGFAVGESLGASALRIAGGIFTKIADIGADLMKLAFGIEEDDARNPGVIADCTGDNAGDSVGPTADGFETYGVTGIALLSFVLLAVPDVGLQATLVLWLFCLRALMIAASGVAYRVNQLLVRWVYAGRTELDFEQPLTSLVWITALVSVAVTYGATWLLLPPELWDSSGTGLGWRLASIVSAGTLAGALIPEVVKVFTSPRSVHVAECVQASREGGASLNVLSGLTAGNFSAFWMGVLLAALMGLAAWLASGLPAGLMLAPAVFAFGLLAFGFLGMGPVTIAVDSYGPVTDNAQSVFELSRIEHLAVEHAALELTQGSRLDFARAKHLLEQNDGAGNTFKATAKPVLIGTAVVGATTMIFATVMGLTHGLSDAAALTKLSLLHPPLLLGLLLGGAVVYWFTGATTQAVTAGAHRAVGYITAHIRLDTSDAASEKDSKAVVEICTRYAQRGMLDIFLSVFFLTLAFAFFEPYFFIGYLLSLALFGLYQAVFMANAGGAWDNAKKVVEVELGEKHTPLHAATVVGDTVGDPFKDTSSVALNPVIKFSTLFGLLALELAVSLGHRPLLVRALSLAFFALACGFVWRTFYAMRIQSAPPREEPEP